MSVPVPVLVLVLVLGCSDADSVSSDPAAYPNHRPHYSVPGHLLAYVTNTLSDTITVIDLDAMTPLGNAPIGRDPVDIDGPTGLAIDRDRGIVYVALSYPAVGHTGHGAAPRAGYLQALALSDLRPLGELRLDVAPSNLALSDDGATLAIAHHDLSRADTITDDVEARRATVALVAPAWAVAAGGGLARDVTVCVAPYAVAFGRTPARLFVACTGEDSLAVVDGAAGTVLARLPAGGESGVGKPYALSADRARGQLLLSARASHQVLLYGMDDGDAPARRFTATLPGCRTSPPGYRANPPARARGCWCRRRGRAARSWSTGARARSFAPSATRTPSAWRRVRPR